MSDSLWIINEETARFYSKHKVWMRKDDKKQDEEDHRLHEEIAYKSFIAGINYAKKNLSN